MRGVENLRMAPRARRHWRAFRDATALSAVMNGLVAPFRDRVDAALESRDFILGGAAATALGVEFIPIGKAGGLFPGPKAATTTGADSRGLCGEPMVRGLSIHSRDRVSLVDDWIETDSQARAAGHLLRVCQAEVAGIAVIVDELTRGAAHPSPRCMRSWEQTSYRRAIADAMGRAGRA